MFDFQSETLGVPQRFLTFDSVDRNPEELPFVGKLLSSTSLWCCLFFSVFTQFVLLEKLSVWDSALSGVKGLNYNIYFDCSVSDESAFYKCPDSLRLPLIFYFGHTAAVYLNKLVLSGLLKVCNCIFGIRNEDSCLLNKLLSVLDKCWSSLLFGLVDYLLVENSSSYKFPKYDIYANCYQVKFAL